MRKQNVNQPLGYAYLIQQYELIVPQHFHVSLYEESSIRRVVENSGRIVEYFPLSFLPKDDLGEHLEFAVKYDGINLCILSALFDVCDVEELVTWILSKPTGKYIRIIWFLYEFLTQKTLSIPDLKQANYTDILDKKKYYTVTPGSNLSRYRLRNNLLGTHEFCPIVRKTERLKNMDRINIYQGCLDLIEKYTPEIWRRASSYLYTKETKSSFEIEREKPSENRLQRFISLLNTAKTEDFAKKDGLVNLQRQIVDPRFASQDYRDEQNYVGESLSFRERIHYICPKPDDVHSLMKGLLDCHQHLSKDLFIEYPLIHAGIISYGFVFIHPFDDGNGRIHRFLLHNIFHLRKFIPTDVIFPISATMLKQASAYEQSLECFSKPLLELIDYNLDANGEMTVTGETDYFYRYIDFTESLELLADFVEQTLEVELVEELLFVERYQKSKQEIQQVVDMPDRLINLFIKCCLSNRGALSNKKRASHFSMLLNRELEEMEAILKTIWAAE